MTGVTRGNGKARRIGLMVGSSLLFAGIMMATGVGGVHAAAACRTDPQVTLSDGVQLTLYEDISDIPSDINSISYQLHIPQGLTVKSIVYQGPVPSDAQTITVSDDENAGNYDGYTVVSARTPNISVAAYMSGTEDDTSTISTHTNGHSAQQLHSHLHLK